MRLFAVRQVWDALTGDELFELKHRKIVRAADWSADSAHIVTGGKEGVLRLYDVSRPEAEPRAGSLSSRRQGPKFVSRPTAHVENRFLTGLRLSFPLKNEKKFGGHLFGPMHRACIRHPPDA